MITEPEIHEITPESPGPEPDAVSKPGFLNLGPPRNGKIAKLSKELRELLNHMLAEGATGAIIIDRFAGLGISLNHENVSNWKHGGYQDWVLEQDWQAEMAAQRESAAALFNTDDETKFLAMDKPVTEIKVRSLPAARNSQPYRNRRACAGNTNDEAASSSRPTAIRTLLPGFMLGC